MIPLFRRDFDAARDIAAARSSLGLGEPATWTPTLTFATPGDLSVAYTTRLGSHIKFGGLVIAHWNIVTSSFTFTTASGNCQITGLPYTSKNNAMATIGTLDFNGITKAGFTSYWSTLSPNAATIIPRAGASGATASNVAAADMPTGGTIILRGMMAYLV